MTKITDNNYSNQCEQRDYIGVMLKEMRLSQGRNQNGYVNEGLSRRLIQRAEYGCNLTIGKLLLILHCYGYTLKDLDFDD